MKGVTAFLMVFLLAACASVPTEAGDPSLAEGGTEATLRTGATQYRAGATAELILTNTFSEQIGYNLCSAALERNRNGSWAAVDPEGRVCTLELRILEPGATTTYRWDLPANLAPGEYRFRTTIHEMVGQATRVVTSNSFQVTG